MIDFREIRAGLIAEPTMKQPWYKKSGLDCWADITGADIPRGMTSTEVRAWFKAGRPRGSARAAGPMAIAPASPAEAQKAAVASPPEPTLLERIRVGVAAFDAAQAASAEKRKARKSGWGRKLLIGVAALFTVIGLLDKATPSKSTGSPVAADAVTAPPRWATATFGDKASSSVIAYEWSNAEWAKTHAPQGVVDDIRAKGWLSPGRFPIMSFNQAMPLCTTPFQIDEAHDAIAAKDTVWASKIAGCSMIPAGAPFEWIRWDMGVGVHPAAQVRFIAKDGSRVTGYTLNPYDKIANSWFPSP